LDGKLEEASIPATCPFRGKGNSADGLGGPDGLVRELLLRFDVSSEENPCHRAILSLFRRIPVSQEGTTVYLNHDFPRVWFLPFSDTDLCMGPPSRLRFLTETYIDPFSVPSPDRGYFAHFWALLPKAQIPRAHQQHIACVPEEGQDLRLVKDYSPDKVKVKEVFVVTYTRRLNGCQIPKPSQVATGARGGS
jgi:hypothetical protein